MRARAACAAVYGLVAIWITIILGGIWFPWSMPGSARIPARCISITIGITFPASFGNDASAHGKNHSGRRYRSNPCWRVPNRHTGRREALPSSGARHGILLYRLRCAGPDGYKQLGTKEKHGIKKIQGKNRENGGNEFQGGKNRNGTGKKRPAHALARCA